MVAKNFQFIYQLVVTNLKSMIALRGSFILQTLFMALNNLTFFVTWWIFFANFKEINGWTIHEMEAMYGLVAGSFGLAVIFAGGMFELGKMIMNGGLDSYIVQPKNVLIHILFSRSKLSGWGDVISSFFLFYLSGYYSWKLLPFIILFYITSALLFISVAVIYQSLSFWLSNVDQLARQMFEFAITFSVYPQSIFPSFMKFIFFTIIPAGLISTVPVQFFMNMNLMDFMIIIIGTASLVTFSFWFFYRGLRHYESGNKIYY